MMTTTNACTTMTIHDDEIAKYLSPTMQTAAMAFITGCALCGSTIAKDYFAICGHGMHHACGPCAKVTSKVCKIEQTRAGPKKCCGAEGCKADFFGPKPDPAFTATLKAGRQILDCVLRDAKNTVERGTTGAERRREAVDAKRNKSRRNKREVIDEEGEGAWESQQASKKARKLELQQIKQLNIQNGEKVDIYEQFIAEEHGWTTVVELCDKRGIAFDAPSELMEEDPQLWEEEEEMVARGMF